MPSLKPLKYFPLFISLSDDFMMVKYGVKYIGMHGYTMWESQRPSRLRLYFL